MAEFLFTLRLSHIISVGPTQGRAARRYLVLSYLILRRFSLHHSDVPQLLLSSQLSPSHSILLLV